MPNSIKQYNLYLKLGIVFLSLKQKMIKASVYVLLNLTAINDDMADSSF